MSSLDDETLDDSDRIAKCGVDPLLFVCTSNSYVWYSHTNRGSSEPSIV